ncbi:hypothetical protein SCHPADRAFT_707063 [Schizopora paradoxa]|uniref:Uncharacterized protein n=1 Tax=Schizopora paradoxa TaxID=27342 RepID=A0A0H2R903_9AGAM|nr:hypothetical protein SCHPADRAFT_707063 [Schizopora paradoxa]
MCSESWYQRSRRLRVLGSLISSVNCISNVFIFNPTEAANTSSSNLEDIHPSTFWFFVELVALQVLGFLRP